MIDIGVNFSHPYFKKHLTSVLQRARENDIESIIATGTDVTTSIEAYSLASQHAGFLYSTAGVHPHEAAKVSSDWKDQLIDLLRSTDVIKAVGETGLDYYRNLTPPSQQLSVFEEHLVIAKEHKLPVFIHDRETNGDVFALVKKYRSSLPAVVIHCFTGTKQELINYLDLDCYIGITGWICDPTRGKRLREIASLIPDNRVMIETDAPYLLPKNMPSPPKNRQNEPAFLPYVLSQLAESRKQSIEALHSLTVENTRYFFSI